MWGIPVELITLKPIKNGIKQSRKIKFQKSADFWFFFLLLKFIIASQRPRLWYTKFKVTWLPAITEGSKSESIFKQFLIATFNFPFQQIWNECWNLFVFSNKPPLILVWNKSMSIFTMCCMKGSVHTSLLSLPINTQCCILKYT